ncbi:hypothetical protein D3C83_322440 [compost metagenome]
MRTTTLSVDGRSNVMDVDEKKGFGRLGHKAKRDGTSPGVGTDTVFNVVEAAPSLPEKSVAVRW